MVVLLFLWPDCELHILSYDVGHVFIIINEEEND